MIDLGNTDVIVEALTLVGIVLAEAIILYVGYGVVERVAAPHLIAYITES